MGVHEENGKLYMYRYSVECEKCGVVFETDEDDLESRNLLLVSSGWAIPSKKLGYDKVLCPICRTGEVQW